MRTVKIALVQFDSKTGATAENVARGIEYVRKASEAGADLIAFPELFAGGYDLAYTAAHRDEVSLSADSPLVQKMAEAAKENHIYVIMPCSLLEDGKYYNGEFLFSRAGEIQGTYGKVHLWDEEAKVFSKGDKYQVFETDFGKLGLMICYDAGFPEASRMLALKGCEVAIVSGAFCHLHWKRWKMYYPARALENTMYVGAVNATGGTDGERWFGNSRFYDTKGDCLLEGSLNVEEMNLVEIDLDKVVEERQAGCYLTDLRPETYQY